MKRRNKAKKIDWEVNNYDQIDYDLLEVRLHSLYKPKNLNFNADLYQEELWESGGYIHISDSQSVRSAIKSFILAFKKILSNFGVQIEEISIDSIEQYGFFKLDLTNCVLPEYKQNYKEIYSGRSKTVEDQIRNIEKTLSMDLSKEKRDELEGWLEKYKTEKLSNSDRLLRFLAGPLTIASYLREDVHLTIGGATKKMQKNLIKWEKSIIECAIYQLQAEKEVNSNS